MGKPIFGSSLSSSAERTAVDEKPSKEYWVYHFAFCLLLPSFATLYSYNIYPFIYLFIYFFIYCRRVFKFHCHPPSAHAHHEDRRFPSRFHQFPVCTVHRLCDITFCSERSVHKRRIITITGIITKKENAPSPLIWPRSNHSNIDFT